MLTRYGPDPDGNMHVSLSGEWVSATDAEHLLDALRKIADRDAWAAKFPYGSYELIAVECIGIARAVLRETGS